MYLFIPLQAACGIKLTSPVLEVWSLNHWTTKEILRPRCFYTGSLGFPDGLYGKESACKAGDLGSIPRLGRSPGEGIGNPLQYTLPGEFHGQRSLAGYSP